MVMTLPKHQGEMGSEKKRGEAADEAVLEVWSGAAYGTVMAICHRPETLGALATKHKHSLRLLWIPKSKN